MPQEATLPQGAKYDAAPTEATLPQGAKYDTPPPTGFLEDLQHLMERTSGERQMRALQQAAHGKHPGLAPTRAALATFAPNTVSRMLAGYRGLATPTNAALGIAATNPYIRALISTYMMLSSGTEGMRAPYDVLYRGGKEALLGTNEGLTPEQIEEKGVKGAMFYGGAAGVREAREVLPGKMKVGAQELAGAGREPVLLAKLNRVRDMKAREQAYRERVAEAETKRTEATEKMRREYGEAVAAREQAKVKSSVAETTRRSYEDLIDRKSEQATQNMVQAERAERAQLDQRWNGLRVQVGNAPVTTTPVMAAIENGREMLMGEPASLKVFNDITRRLTEKGEAIDTPKGVVRVPAEDRAGIKESMSFNEARTHYTALGEGLSGDIPWNVRQALEHVQGALDKSIKDTITSAGGAQTVSVYDALKRDWSDYLRTWRDLRPIAKGGSPLARVIALSRSQLARGGMPISRQAARMVITNNGEAAMYLLAKKRAFGADPSIVASLRAANRALKALPKTTGKIPSVERPEFPKAKPVRKPEEPGPLDPVAIRRRKLLESASRRANIWEILFPPYLIEHLALKYPSIREWIAKHPRHELPVPEEGETK